MNADIPESTLEGVDVRLVKSSYLTGCSVDERIKRIKQNVELLRLGNKPFQEVIGELKDEKGFEKRILDSLNERDFKQTLRLIRRVEELLLGYSNLNRVGYSDAELETMFEDFMEGRRDDVYLYMSDG